MKASIWATLWDFLRERLGLVLLLLVALVVVVSAARRKARLPPNELYRLVKGLVDVISAVVLVGWIAVRKNSELGGLSTLLLLGTTVFAYDAFCSFYDAIKSAWTKPVAEVDPVPPGSSRKLEPEASQTRERALGATEQVTAQTAASTEAVAKEEATAEK